MSRSSQVSQGPTMDTELDQSRLAGWEQREGYSPFMPPPGMVAHGQFTQTNDPIPVYNFGQFHTPNQHLQYPAQNTNTAQHAQSQPYQHTYEQPRFHEPQPQQVLQFPRFTPPLNRQAMPFTPTEQSNSVSSATYQQAQDEANHHHLLSSSLSSTVQIQQEQLAEQSAKYDALLLQMEQLQSLTKSIVSAHDAGKSATSS